MLVVAFVVAVVGPAWADDPVDDGPPPALGDLAALVTAQTDEISTVPPLAAADLDSWLDAKVARLDLLIGTVRVDAVERIRWMFPGLDVSTPDLLVGGSSLLRHRIDRQGPLARWPMEQATVEWQRLEQSIEELRRLAGERAPLRLCPVAGPVDLENDWHDDRPGGRVHKGTDVHGDIGTPLLAIEAGTVLQASWHWSGGRQIYVRGDSTGDVYYYAHLDAWSEWVWTGTRVEAGDEIGTLGRSGNAHSPHLHFGWMPGSGGVDLENLQNPYPLLVEICR